MRSCSPEAEERKTDGSMIERSYDGQYRLAPFATWSLRCTSFPLNSTGQSNTTAHDSSRHVNGAQSLASLAPKLASHVNASWISNDYRKCCGGDRVWRAWLSLIFWWASAGNGRKEVARIGEALAVPAVDERRGPAWDCPSLWFFPGRSVRALEVSLKINVLFMLISLSLLCCCCCWGAL